jgi:hypothetical protein
VVLTVLVDGTSVQITAYQILNRNDCIITAARDKAVELDELMSHDQVASVQFCEDGTPVNEAELLLRDLRLETDDTGSRGYLTCFVLSYAELPQS